MDGCILHDSSQSLLSKIGYVTMQGTIAIKEKEKEKEREKAEKVKKGSRIDHPSRTADSQVVGRARARASSSHRRPTDRPRSPSFFSWPLFSLPRNQTVGALRVSSRVFCA
jgi:hypothetical protein